MDFLTSWMASRRTCGSLEANEPQPHLPDAQMSGVTQVTSKPASRTCRPICSTLSSLTCHRPTSSTPVRPLTCAGRLDQLLRGQALAVTRQHVAVGAGVEGVDVGRETQLGHSFFLLQEIVTQRRKDEKYSLRLCVSQFAVKSVDEPPARPRPISAAARVMAGASPLAYACGVEPVPQQRHDLHAGGDVLADILQRHPAGGHQSHVWKRAQHLGEELRAD